MLGKASMAKKFENLMTGREKTIFKAHFVTYRHFVFSIASSKGPFT